MIEFAFRLIVHSYFLVLLCILRISFPIFKEFSAFPLKFYLCFYKLLCIFFVTLKPETLLCMFSKVCLHLLEVSMQLFKLPCKSLEFLYRIWTLLCKIFWGLLLKTRDKTEINQICLETETDSIFTFMQLTVQFSFILQLNRFRWEIPRRKDKS